MFAAFLLAISLILTYLVFVGVLTFTYFQCWAFFIVYAAYKVFVFLIEAFFGANKY